MSTHTAEGSFFGSRLNLEVADAARPVLRDILATFEKSIILAVLLAADGNQRRAAMALGVLPTTLQEKLKRFGLLDQRFGRGARRGERVVRPNDVKPPLDEAPTTPTKEQQ
ncbi:MAG: helix-turn-helix domain-containing protein [Vicinamibacteria bacterium]